MVSNLYQSQFDSSIVLNCSHARLERGREHNCLHNSTQKHREDLILVQASPDKTFLRTGMRLSEKKNHYAPSLLLSERMSTQHQMDCQSKVCLHFCTTRIQSMKSCFHLCWATSKDLSLEIDSKGNRLQARQQSIWGLDQSWLNSWIRERHSEVIL